MTDKPKAVCGRPSLKRCLGFPPPPTLGLCLGAFWGGMGIRKKTILKPSLNINNNFNHREKNVIIHPQPHSWRWVWSTISKKQNVVNQDAEWKQLYMEGQELMAQVWERPLQNCQRWPMLETASEAGGWKMLEQNDQKHLGVYSVWYLFSWPYNWILSWQKMRNSSILHVAILVVLHQVQSHPLQCYHSCHCYQATLTQTFGANYAQHTPAV